MGPHEPLSEARQFINDSVFLPILKSKTISGKLKNVARNSSKWIAQIDHIGDLLIYMERCAAAPSAKATYQSLHNAGLTTYEDIIPVFRERYGAWVDRRLSPWDFVVGAEYSSTKLVIVAGRFETRAGGILPVGEVGSHIAVLVKATIAEGKYANRWITRGLRMKYYLQSINGAFRESFAANRSIIDFPHIPVLIFWRQTKNDSFVYAGQFASAGVHDDPSGAKWFDLVRRDQEHVLLTEETVQRRFEEQVERAKKDTAAARQERLKSAAKTPRTVTVMAKVFERNPDVVVEVLRRAGGVCERCRKPAPFMRRSDGSPYLEVHHKIPLSQDGEDSIENAVALCPNCHRDEHFGCATLVAHPSMGT